MYNCKTRIYMKTSMYNDYKCIYKTIYRKLNDDIHVVMLRGIQMVN